MSLGIDEIRERLEEIYRQIPDGFDCKRCGGCCGPITWFEPERIVVQEYCKKYNIEYKEWRENLEQVEKKMEEGNILVEEDFKCPFIKENQCIIYPARPLICRLQGSSSELPCSNSSSKPDLSRQVVDNMWRAYHKIEQEMAG